MNKNNGASITPKKGRRSVAKDVPTRILDAAETLFAEVGYFGASVRDITNAAGTRLGAVNYYFDSKEALLDLIIQRRYKVIDDERLIHLDLLQASSGTAKFKLSKMVDAFVLPLITRVIEGQDGWDNYVRLLAQIWSRPSRWCNFGCGRGPSSGGFGGDV